jgi:hypothetical protein
MSTDCNCYLENLDYNNTPSIAQLVERWTVVVMLADIHRSLVQLQFEGIFLWYVNNLHSTVI